MTIRQSVVFDFNPRPNLQSWEVATDWGVFAAVTGEDGSLAALAFPAPGACAGRAAEEAALSGHPSARAEWKGRMPDDALLARQLREYLSGERHCFDLTVAAGRHRPFDTAVWRATAQIPFGSVLTYGEVAREVGRPRSSRAAGGALGRNPTPIVVPCHRVVRSGGGLGGFSGGLEWKTRMLEFESGHQSEFHIGLLL